MATTLVSAAGSFELGADTTINRLGFGSIRLPGEGVWGEPSDPAQAVRVLRRAVELGVNFIDMADCYGPFVAELLIKRALRPYPNGLGSRPRACHARRAWTL